MERTSSQQNRALILRSRLFQGYHRPCFDNSVAYDTVIRHSSSFKLMRMHSPQPSIDAGMKQLRTLLFPRDFVKELLWSLARRSQYIMAQLECLAEDASEHGSRDQYGLHLPEELGSLWLEALFLTPADLRATARTRLIEYLKVCI